MDKCEIKKIKPKANTESAMEKAEKIIRIFLENLAMRKTPRSAPA
jgi:hypothetical protein